MNLISLIEESSFGNKEATDILFQTVYSDLKGLARKIRFNWRTAETLNTTALVHESYIKVLRSKELSVKSQLHFYHLCGQAMRYVLKDYLEKKNAVKRGSNQSLVSIDNAYDLGVDVQAEHDLHIIIEILEKLEKEDELISKIVECRFFSDLTIEETAQALSVSPATVKRKWTFAKAYLSDHIKKSA
jgi:RNA polymerase sigma factor (TIGR02999 family)